MLIACDTETELIQPWKQVPDLVVISVSDGNPSDTHLIHGKDGNAGRVARAVIDGESVWANAPFDLCVFASHWPENTRPIFDALEEARVHDVLVREKLLDIAKGHYKMNRARKGQESHIGYSLRACLKRNGHAKGDDLGGNDWRLRYAELMDVPLEQWPLEASLYARADSLSTHWLYENQEQRRSEWKALHKGDVLGDEFRQVRAKWGLHLSTVWGLRVDQNQVREYEAQVREEWERAGETLRQAGILRADGTRDMKIACSYMESLCSTAGFEPTRTARGQVCLDEDACLDRRIGDGFSPHPLFQAFRDYTSHQKILSSYIQYLKNTGEIPIHPKYDELVDTGRTSCYEPNVQQLPRKPGVRECYVPRPGCAFIQCDYDKAELVSLAQICLMLFKRSKLADALRGGFDPHLQMGIDMLAASGRVLTYEEAMAIMKTDEQVKNARQAAKPANFGFPGGMGAQRMMEYAWSNSKVRLTLAQATALREQWKASWPELPEYLDWISQLTGDGTANVQAVRSGRCRGHVSYSECANGFFQQLTADAAKHAVWRVTWHQFCEPASALYGTHIVAFIHDEIIVECPIDRAQGAAQELEQVMVDAYNEWTPDVPVTATARIEDRWRKN
jgi:hypothetical protein